jgi:hypothetical protein
MAAIQPGVIRFNNVYQYDMFDVTFEITGINIGGKTLKCQVRESADTPVVLEFIESDGSLIKTVVSTTLTNVRFYKESEEMKLPPLSEPNMTPKYYQLTIIMYTDDSDVEDVVTIVTGTMNVIAPITTVE